MGKHANKICDLYHVESYLFECQRNEINNSQFA